MCEEVGRSPKPKSLRDVTDDELTWVLRTWLPLPFPYQPAGPEALEPEDQARLERDKKGKGTPTGKRGRRPIALTARTWPEFLPILAAAAHELARRIRDGRIAKSESLRRSLATQSKSTEPRDWVPIILETYRPWAAAGTRSLATYRKAAAVPPKEIRLLQYDFKSRRYRVAKPRTPLPRRAFSPRDGLLHVVGFQRFKNSL